MRNLQRDSQRDAPGDGSPEPEVLRGRRLCSLRGGFDTTSSFGEQTQGFAPGSQGGRQRGHPTAGLGQDGMGEDVLGDGAAALMLWTDRHRGSWRGTTCKTQHEPPAEPRRRAAQPRAATWHLPPLASPPGRGEGAHTAPQAPGAPRQQPSCARHPRHGHGRSIGSESPWENGPRAGEGELC